MQIIKEESIMFKYDFNEVWAALTKAFFGLKNEGWLKFIVWLFSDHDKTR